MYVIYASALFWFLFLIATMPKDSDSVFASLWVCLICFYLWALSPSIWDINHHAIRNVIRDVIQDAIRDIIQDIIQDAIRVSFKNIIRNATRDATRNTVWNAFWGVIRDTIQNAFRYIN